MLRFNATHRRTLTGGILALSFLLALRLGPSLWTAAQLNAGYLGLVRTPPVFESARSWFQDARRSAPQALAVSRAVGVLALAQGDALAARVEFQQVVDGGQADDVIYWNLGRALDAAGDRQTATLEYRLAGAAPYFYNAGMRLRHQKDWQGAEAALLRALEIAPQDPALARALGEFYVDWNKPDLALVRLRRALELEVRDYEQALLQAEIARLEGDPAAAVLTLEDALRLMPMRPEAYRLLAGSWFESGDIERAIRVLERGAVSATRTFGLNLRLAQLLIAQGQWELAGQALARARTEDPNSDEGWLVTAQLEFEQGHAQSALEALENAVALAPDNAESYFMLGRVHARLGQCELARLAYARAIALAPDDPRFDTAHQVWESCD